MRAIFPSLPSFLTLLLFVLRILANDHHDPLPLDDLAFVTDFLNRRSNFHSSLKRHSRLQTPLSVKAIVCSKWADLLPSAVTAVQPIIQNFHIGPAHIDHRLNASTMPTVSLIPV
jgi:hypothetical protein